MRRSRPPFQDKDAGARRAAQASVAPNKRLRRGQSAEPSPSPGDASDTTVAPAAALTGETASPRNIPPGVRQYQVPTLQKPPQPWSDQSETPLPLRVAEEQGQPTTTDDENRPQNNPAGNASPNAETIFVSKADLSAAAVRAIPTRLMGAEVKLVDAEAPELGGNQFFVSSTSNQEKLRRLTEEILDRLAGPASVQQQQRPARCRVPSSSAPISREYPTTSAARIAARRRVWLTSSRPPRGAGPIITALVVSDLETA
jgi:hypothetical protein